ncbi:MAG: hypothetical protein FWF72_04380 [Paludibacter sp.]|nr:hypothetical protein [Paludibacter sp.]
MSRTKRINPPVSANWFDVDYPQIIELCKNFFTENNNYQMIASSVTEVGWLEQIPNNRPAIIAAEGVLMYITPAEVENLFMRLMNYFFSWRNDV